MQEAPYGFCQCGCGQRTSIAKENNPKWGHVRGEPVRFITGHVRRARGPAYVEEDRGHDTPCWIWRLTTNGKGYGVAWNGERTAGAHRVFFERAKGDIPSGCELDHLCGQRACVNPDHLEAVTHAENVRRGRNAKLSLELAEQIRARVAAGEMQGAIARELGVNKTTVSRVVLGRTWQP